MTNLDKPRLFVGSSREGLEIARTVQFHLHEVALVSVWNEGVFGLSQGTLESLVRMLEKFDFAVLVITPDDVISGGGSQRQSPRDNVMFELGLFMGRLGQARTFAVCSDSPDLKLPSDLAGVTMARFNSRDAARDVMAALGPACLQLRQAIRELGFLNSQNFRATSTRVTEASALLNAVKLADLRASPGAPIRGDTLTLEYVIESTLNIRVWLGASLGRNGVYVYNITQDKEVTLTVGRETHIRYLTIPPEVEIGTYELQVEVWFGELSIPDYSIPLVRRWPDRILEVR